MYSGQVWASPKDWCVQVLHSCISYPIPLDISIHGHVCILITQNEDVKHYIFSVGQGVLCSSMSINPAFTTVGYRCPQIAFIFQGWLNRHPQLAWLRLPPSQQCCCSSTTIFSPEFRPCLSILFVYSFVLCFNNIYTKKQFIHFAH